MRFRPMLLLLLPLLAAAVPTPRTAPTVVQVPRPVLDSMGVLFARYNAGWERVAGLNTMERMLGQVRKGAVEYLGCLTGTVRGDTVVVQGLGEARDLRQLPQAATGSCDEVPGVVGTWHTHPFLPDEREKPIKARALSFTDLKTLESSPYAVSLMLWDVDSVDAATKHAAGDVRHPAAVVLLEAGRP